MTKILVIGLGAVGCLYAAKLQQAGAQVAVVCRSNFEEVKSRGISVKSIWGDFVFQPNQVLKNCEEYEGEADFIIAATKIVQGLNLPQMIAPAVSKNTTIALIQNGIFIEDEMARAFPNNHLLSVIAFVDVIRDSLNSIIHAGDGKLTIGEFLNPNPQKTRQLADLFEKVSVPIILSANIQFDRWKKLLWNASFNPISVVCGNLDTKQILDNLELKRLVRAIMLEVKGLAKLQGCEIEEQLIDQMIASTNARKTPAITSMLVDYRAHRPMEIEAILGNALRFAAKNNAKAPLIEDLYNKLKIVHASSNKQG
jgi:2-dehydropantoate 2-reductase